jgi:outer membrane lipoprotein-sorting protein
MKVAGAVFVFLVVAAGVTLVAAPTTPASPAGTDDVLAKSKAVYAGLKSYSDTGTVDEEYGPRNAHGHDRHTFKTFYRGPRHFYFDFVKFRGTDRWVAWSNDDNTLHIWWKTSHQEESYPKGKWQVPLLIGGSQTKGSLTQLSPFFFPEDKLFGTLTELGDTAPAGKEVLNGHECFKIKGTARSVYQGTGHVVNIRPVTVWIDAQTLLVRKVFEDTAQGAAPGWVQQTTTTFEPQANPTLTDAQFQFKPPGK